VDFETHEGDRGSIYPAATRTADLDMRSAIHTTLIIGRGLVVHCDLDEGSRSEPAGNLGPRLAQRVLDLPDANLS
jgi:Cu/Zn superoxide dismutase